MTRTDADLTEFGGEASSRRGEIDKSSTEDLSGQTVADAGDAPLPVPADTSELVVVRDGASAPTDGREESVGARVRALVAGVDVPDDARGRALVGGRTDTGTDANAGADADPLADPHTEAGEDARADALVDWRDRASAHYATTREYVRTGWGAWVRLIAYLRVCALALYPHANAPAEANVPDWAHSLAPYVADAEAWARAELRSGPLFARWLGWVEDRQNRMLAAAGGVGTLVALVLALAGHWPIGGLLGALALWGLTLLYVPMGAALAVKQYRGEFDRDWRDLPDQ